jgi:hypothetical protein
MEESFVTLLKSKGHWEFEIFLIFIFDVVIGVLIWPTILRWWKHHKMDDDKLEQLERRIDILERMIDK